VAEEIRAGILSETGVCDLVELRDVDPASLHSFDLVGLGCPVFYCQEPLNVRDFIAALPRMPDRQWFVFCTHGAIMGVTLQSMAEALQRKGIDVIGYHDTYAGATLPFYPYPMLTAGHPDDAATAWRRASRPLQRRPRQCRVNGGKTLHSLPLNFFSASFPPSA
jgi:hypothetical protein